MDTLLIKEVMYLIIVNYFVIQRAVVPG